ncbi:HRH1 [Branchiostoma lanceolatum]|uniref:HRH1 protein n=1 Tax=Branchiostoma lanceolatum TaxID=7740 RepID=A0A8K0EFI9_BRALA|nr:HRH1 [Branchiostoma lanceolatum]
MTTTGEYILVVVIGIIIVVSVIGCLLTIVAIWTRPALRKPVNIPLASLSCADILFTIFYSSFWIQYILYPLWEPPAALCWVTAYASPVLFGVSANHMLCIALQRYFKICTNSTRLKSTRVLVIMLLLTWLVPIVTFLPLFVGEEVKVDTKLKRCAMMRSDKLWAKVFPAILNVFIPFVATIIVYILIRNHVRESKKRVRANAVDPRSNRLAVKYSGGNGDDAGPSTSRATVRVTKHSRGMGDGVWEGGVENYTSSDEEQGGNECVVGEGDNNSTSSDEEQGGNECVVGEGDNNSTSSDEEQGGNECVVGEGDNNSTSSDEEQGGNECVVGEGDNNSTSSDEEQGGNECVVGEGERNASTGDEEQNENDCIEPGEPKDIPVTTASDTIEQQHHVGQGQNPCTEQSANDKIEPDEPNCIILTPTATSDQANSNERQQAIPGNRQKNDNNATDRQITKMMMIIFAVFTVCCLPAFLMMIFSSKFNVPAEAFIVGQLLLTLNSALNPIVYGVMNKNIRQGYKHIWDSMLNYIT